uniref:Choline/carnitine acyltransferase domain-containing protein n=1 Tax=Acrobeloides nanus TaxID=290746 RepID=A0A914CXY3_9BILA
MPSFSQKNQFFNDKTGIPTEKPHKLEFEVVEDDKEALKKAAKRINDAAADLEIKFYLFQHFGKNIPKLAKISPDSFIQVAFQLAFYRLHGKHAPTYETATLRKFDEGRTDTIRSPTMDSKVFVEAMEAKKPDSEVAKLFRAATEAHKNYAVSCMHGRGVDRHLLGLRLAARENGLPMPDVFKTEAYQKMMHFLISTSQVPTRHLIPMGFGPSESDCYGVCYNPQEHHFSFTITTYNHYPETSAQTFAKTLEKTLLDIRDLLDRAGQLQQKAKL